MEGCNFYKKFTIMRTIQLTLDEQETMSRFGAHGSLILFLIISINNYIN